MRYVSLFSGIGGLDRAVDAIGGTAVVQVEREPYCRAILAQRWPDVPKHDDVTTYHPPTDGSVDMVIGGPPCQPVSHAGRRKGTEDERWLWGEALRVVREAQPSLILFENPMGLRTLGLDAILSELSGMGYGGAWEVVAAADVGAPHLRKRIFIFGECGREGWDGPTRPKGNRKVLWPTPTASGERPNEGNVRLLRARVVAGDMTAAAAAAMLNGKDVFSAQGKVPALLPTPTRSGGAGGAGTTPKREGGLNLRTFAAHWPTPTSRDHKDTGDSIVNGTVPINGLLGRAVMPSTARGALSPDWVEWLMGLPIGWTDANVADPGPLHGWADEPAIPRVGLGIPNRSKRLTALGNAVVPQQAAFALERLVERLRGAEDAA